MIQDIFLPEKIGNYYIFSQKVVGIDITKSHIHATLVKIQGTTTTIEKQVSEPLTGDPQNYTERVKATLPTVMQTMGKATHIRTNIPSSQVVFKELRIPFTSYEKISLVIRFEVEPLLPFAAEEAIIDFIITHINTEEKTAQVLVAATQKQYIAQHLELFQASGIYPSDITVDMFALYGLYTQIPAYNALPDTIILLDLDMQSTRIVAIDDHQLRIIRSLPYGLATTTKETGAPLKPAEIADHLIRFGIDSSSKAEKNQALAANLTTYFNKLQFALSSTITSLYNKKISKILVIGAGADIKDIAPFAQTILQSPCELFDGQQLLQNKAYRINKNVTLSSTTLLSAATALTSFPIDNFNLAKEEFAAPQTSLFLKQIIVAGILMIALFGSLITHTIIQTRRLKNEIQVSQTEAVEELKKWFPTIPEEEDALDDVVELAKNELKKEENIWLAFSSQARTSFLEYLLELSTHINKQELGFEPEQLTLVEGPSGQLTLKAKVRDFEALKQLEKALHQSKLFSYIESPRLPEFTMKITVAHAI